MPTASHIRRTVQCLSTCDCRVRGNRSLVERRRIGREKRGGGKANMKCHRSRPLRRRVSRASHRFAFVEMPARCSTPG